MFRRPQYIVSFSFFVSMAMGSMVVALPLIAKERLGVPPEVLGYYGFANGLLYTICALFSGRLSERFGRRSVLAVALALCTASALLAIWSRTPRSFFLPMALWGFSMGMIWPGVEAAMADGQTTRQIKRAAGLFNYAWLSGLVVGPVIGGLLYQRHHALPIWLGAGILLAFLVILFLPRAMEIARWGRGGDFDHEERIQPDKRALFVRLAFIGNITSYFFIGAYRALLPEYATPLGIADWRYGLLLGANMGGMILANALLIRWHRWHYSLRFLVATELAAAALLALFATVDSYGLLVAIAALLGVPSGVTYYSSMYYGMAQNPSKGTHCGYHEAFIGVGQILGPLCGGLIIAATGVPRAYMAICAAAWVLAACTQTFLARRCWLPALKEKE